MTEKPAGRDPLGTNDFEAAEALKKQILIVEDEGLIADDIRRRLERLGYSVPAIAHSGDEALAWARSTPFDLVLMDIRLNGRTDGIATAQTLKDELQMPVVYITAHADSQTVTRAKFTEPLGYVIKPIGDGNLRSVVEIALYKCEMERRLRTSEAWLATTLRSVGDAIIATDTGGDIFFLNPVAEQLTGWSAGEAHGQPLMVVLSLYEEATTQEARNPVFELLPGENRSYTLVSKAGVQRVVEIGCFENRSAEEVLGAILVVRDIGARRDLEASLVQSQRMEAVASMAGGLAHDFNNQLMVILGYAEALSARLTGEHQVEAREIKHSATIAHSITNQLLTLSRHDTECAEVLNLNELVREMEPILSSSLGRGRTLVTDLGSPAGYVKAGRNHLKQVLLNLALNARDAMPGAGELRIESSTVEIDGDSPAARLYRPQRYARLRVADSGEGMDKATLARIFEPFFTTKAAGRGTGLGLAMAHSIIVQNGGYIGAASEVGAGTSFEILLPCIGTFQGASDGGTGDNAEGPAPTVLMVEDEDRVRRLMHSYLENEGLQLLDARNGEEALLMAQAYRAPIAVLITDVVMPGVTGPQLAEKLAPLHPEIQVLYVSGYRHDRLEHDGLLRHDANILSKPFPASELWRQVRALLGRAAGCPLGCPQGPAQ